MKTSFIDPKVKRVEEWCEFHTGKILKISLLAVLPNNQ